MNRRLRNYFIPNEQNTYQPHALQSMSVAVMAILILLSFALANIQSLVWLNSDWLVSSVLPAVVVDLTNEERSFETLTALKRNPLLDEAARMKAEDMATREYFAHYSPDGISPWHWIRMTGYDFVSAGENLAVHFTDSEDVFEGWMSSPSHRANILSDSYTEIGVGTARGEYEGYPTVFVVQFFGAPASLPNQAGEDTILSQENASAVTEESVGLGGETVPAGGGTVAAAQLANVEESNTENTTASFSRTDSAAESSVSPVEVAGMPDTESPSTIMRETNLVLRTATQPHSWLQILYGVLALFVIVALALSILIEWRRQHPLQIMYGSGLLIVMALLFFIQANISGGVSVF